jgi:glutaredoxin
MCTKVKNLLKEKSLIFQVIDCDDYLIEDKEGFLSFIENNIGKSYKSFPIVFNDGKFIGGFQETNDYVQKILLEFEEMF